MNRQRSPQPDVAVSLEFLKRHYEASQGWATVRALDLNTKKVESIAWAEVSNIDSLGPQIEELATNPKLDLYFGVAPRRELLSGKQAGEIGDCLDLPCLWHDIDIEGPTHKAPNLPVDDKEAWDLIMALGLRPSVVIHSGHGLQPLWNLNDEGIHEGNAEYLERWVITWQRISEETGFHIDNVWDVPRILRLPGTLNNKIEPVLVTYQADWNQVYTLADLDTALDPLGRHRSSSNGSNGSHSRSDRDRDPQRDLCDGERNTGLTSSAGKMRRIGMEPDGIEAALLVENERRCKPPLKASEVKSIARSVGRYDPVEEEEVNLRRPAQEWPRLGQDALYGLAGDIVNTLAPHTEADPAGLLAETLVQFGNCVGLGPHIRIGAARHPAKLFANLVGNSARARKDTARAEVGRLFSLVDPDWVNGRQIRGLGSGEGLIEKVKDPPAPKERGPAPESEDEKELRTPSQSGDVFAEDHQAVIERGWQSLEPDVSADKRYVVVESEFGRLITVAQREGSILAPVVCMAWDSDALDITTRKLSAHATNCHISLVGHITIEGLRRQLTKAEALEGFANRFLFFLVRNSGNKLPIGGNLQREELNALARKVRVAIKRAREVTGPLAWTPAAEALYTHYYHEMGKDEPGGLLGGIVARNQPQVLRLIATCALMDKEPGKIDVPHVKTAMAVWEYCRASAAYVFGDSTGDDVAERIRDELKLEYPAGLDRESLNSDVLHRNATSTRITQALATLQSMGVIRIVIERTGQRGRPREIVYFVPPEERT